MRIIAKAYSSRSPYSHDVRNESKAACFSGETSEN
jgi:hypothetical protein